MKRDITKIFIDEIYSKRTRKSYETIKIVYNHVVEIWSIDLADMIEYNMSNNKGCGYIIIIIHKLSEKMWAMPSKIENPQTITNEFSNVLNSSKRGPIKVENDRGA